MADLKKTVDGKALSADQFAYVGDPNDISTWHLPIMDGAHARDAMSRFDQADMPDAAKKKAAAKKIADAADKFGIDDAGFEKAHGLSDPDDKGENMAGLNDQWVEVFRAGTFDGGSGPKQYGDADLAKLVANYNAKEHEAPIVIGHPETDAPAFGWVKGLKKDGDTVLAQLHQVQPQFEELVRSGMYKKRSVGMYVTPDGLKLRHVGFLGAMPPEVKGLADVKFGDGGLERLTFTTEDEMDPNQIKKTVGEEIRSFFSELFKGKEAAAAPAFDEAALAKKISDAVDAATKPLKDRLATFSEKAATDSTKAAADAAIAKVKAAQRWIPAFDKMGLPALFTELAKSTATVEFSEKRDGKDVTTKKGLAEIFAEFLCGLPELVPGGDITKSMSSAAAKGVRFNESKGVVLDMDSVEFSEAARKRSAEKKIDLGVAMRELRAEGWKPTQVGAAAAGAV